MRKHVAMNTLSLIAATLGLIVLCAGGCTSPGDEIASQTSLTPPNDGKLHFLALGDSYTIGESVPETDRWPVQLVAMLRDDGVEVGDPQIIARTGWTCEELSAAIDDADPTGEWDLVSLLIGVNDQYRKYDIEQYESRFAALLDKAIDFAGGDASGVIVVAIPDWGVTPFGEESGRAEETAEALDRYNAINARVAASRGVKYVDIAAVSREAATRPELVAVDGLHPSGELYTEWAKLVLPKAKAVLAR